MTLAYATCAPRWGVPGWVWAIVVLAVTLRFGFALTRGVSRTALSLLPDQIEYLDIADSIRGGRGIQFVEHNFADIVYSFRMPAYPAFIAGLGGNPRVVQFAQAVLDGSSVLAVFLIGRRFGNVATGGVAATLVALHPYLIYFSALFLSETLFTAFVAWGIWAVLQPRAAWRAGGVAMLLASVYVRPSAVALGVVVAAVVYWDGLSRSRRLLQSVLACGVASLLLVALLFPWAYRNDRVNDRWIWLTTNGGYTAYDSFNPDADGSSNQAVFLPELRDRDAALYPPILSSTAWPLSAPPVPTTSATSTPGSPVVASSTYNVTAVFIHHDEVGRNDFLNARAREYVRTHPGRVVELAFAKLRRFWSPMPLSADFGASWPYVLAGGGFVVPLFAFTLVGIWRGGLGRRTTLILLLPALYFTAVHSVFVGSLRYRVPCDVPMAVVAAAGAVSLFGPKVTTPENLT